MTVFAQYPEAIIPDSYYKDYGYFWCKKWCGKENSREISNIKLKL